jgi:hypothetical protein
MDQKIVLLTSRRRQLCPYMIMKTLPIINKPKNSKKEGIQGTKWKDPCPRRQKEPPKRANHKG